MAESLPVGAFQSDEQNGEQVLVFVAYRDVAAGQRAMRLVSRLGKGVSGAARFVPILWAFALLTDSDSRQAATQDLSYASVLILADEGPSPLPDPVQEWVQEAVLSRSGNPTAVVALVGSKDGPDGSISERCTVLKHAAQRAGADFFTPSFSGRTRVQPPAVTGLPEAHPHSAITAEQPA